MLELNNEEFKEWCKVTEDVRDNGFMMIAGPVCPKCAAFEKKYENNNDLSYYVFGGDSFAQKVLSEAGVMGVPAVLYRDKDNQKWVSEYIDDDDKFEELVGKMC